MSGGSYTQSRLGQAQATLTIAKGGKVSQKQPPQTQPLTNGQDNLVHLDTASRVQVQRTSVPLDTSHAHDAGDSWQPVPRDWLGNHSGPEDHSWKSSTKEAILVPYLTQVRSTHRVNIGQSPMLPTSETSEGLERWLAETPKDAPFHDMKEFKTVGCVECSQLPMDNEGRKNKCSAASSDGGPQTLPWSWEFV